jgi:hypothetical protein
MVAHAALLAERPMMPTRIGAIGKDWKRTCRIVLRNATWRRECNGEKTYLQSMADVISLSVQSNSKDRSCPWSPRQSFTTCIRSIRNQLGRTKWWQMRFVSRREHGAAYSNLGRLGVGPPNRMIWACGGHTFCIVAETEDYEYISQS